MDWPYPAQDNPDKRRLKLRARLIIGPLKSRRIRHQLLLVGFVATLVLPLLVLFNDSAEAAPPYTASSVLGQLDGNGNPRFTSNDLYNISSAPPDGYTNIAALNTPSGLAVDEVNHLLFVSDEFNNRVLVFQLDTNNQLNSYIPSFVLGQESFNVYDFGLQADRMDTPMALYYDNNREWLFVADDGYSRVLVFDLSGGITNGMNASYVLGQPDFTTSNSGTAQNQLNGPTGLGFDPATENLFVGDFSSRRVVVFDTTSITNGMNASYVLGQPDFTTSSADTTQNGTNSVSGVHYDPGLDYLFVADDSNNRTLIFDLSGGISDGMNASYVLGQGNFTSGGSAITQAGSDGPIDIAYDPVRELIYVAEFDGSRTMVYDISGGISDGMNATYVIGQPNFTAQDFTRDQNGQDSPFAIEYVSSSDTLLVGDYLRVLEYDASATATSMNAQGIIGQNNGNAASDYTTYFGEGFGWFSSSFASSEAVLLDTTDHRLFVADQENQRIMVYNLDGSNNLTSSHANYVIGRQNFYTMNLNATPSQSNLMWDFSDQPMTMTYDAVNNRLFVADLDFFRVMVFDFSSGITNGMNASYVLGQPNFTSNGQAVTQSGMTMPTGIVHDSANQRLFVSDGPSNRVLVYDLSSGITNGMNASYVLGQSNFTSSAGPAMSGSEPNKVGYPQGLSYDVANERLFVAEGSHVKIFDLTSGISNNMNASFILGDTDFTYGGISGLSYRKRFGGSPESLWYDPTNQALFATDPSFNRVLTFNLSDGVTNGQSAADVIGQSNYGDNSSGLSQTKFDEPTGVAYDAANQRLYISDNDNNRVMIYDSMAVPDNPPPPYAASDVLGQVDGGGAGVFNQNGQYNGAGFANPNDEGFWQPGATVIDKVNHRLFVGECGYGVKVFNLDSNNQITDRTADYVLGQASFTANDDTTVDAATAYCSYGVSHDSANNRLFVNDANHNRVLVYDLSSGITNGMNASYVLGQSNFTSSGAATTQSGMDYNLAGNAYDPVNQRLYVGDLNNARVLVYDLSSGITNGMNASFVIGQPDFTSNTPSLTQDGLGAPYSLVHDSAGQRLFVADWDSAGRVLVYDTSSLSNGMNASYVLGEADFVSNNSASDLGQPPDAKSFGPEGLSYDSAHQRLFIGDGNANRIMVFDVSSITNNEDAVTLLGQPSFLDDDYSCNPTEGYLCSSSGASDYYDTTNNRMYVADTYNHRVMVYYFADLVESLPSGTSGTAYSSGTGAYAQGTPTYTVTAGSLPPGINLNSSSGLLSGTPSSSGNFNFTIGLSDNNGSLGTYNDSKAYVLSIASGSPDVTPPSVPTGLQQTASTTTSVSISWTPSTDNVGVAGYHIFRGGVQVGDTASTNFTDTGLSPGTTYSYTVTAYDAASNESAQSSALNAFTANNPSGGGGSPGGGSSGGGSSGGGSSTGAGGSTASPSGSTTPPATIDLDQQPGFNNGTGYKNEAVVGSTYIWSKPKNSGQNTISVQEISGSNIVLTISDGSQITAASGSQISQDMDGDGQPDILIIVGDIDGGRAELTFKNLSPPASVPLAPSGGQALQEVQPAGFFEVMLNKLNALLKAIFADVPPQAIWAFPWLIFILLALTIARLLWQAREQAKAAYSIRLLTAREKQLGEEKHNFITLSSHYLRTPLTVISGGIELLGSISGKPVDALAAKAGGMGEKINNLLAGFNQYSVSPASSVIAGPRERIWSQPSFYLPVGLAFALVAFANYLYSAILSYQATTVGLMTQIVAGLLLAVLLLASKRRFAAKSSLRRIEEALLAGERQLDADRNELIKASVAELETDLAGIRRELQSLSTGDNAKQLKPALKGVADFEATIAKFKTVAGLESIGVARRTAMMDLYAVLDNLLTRHAVDIKAKNLTVEPRFNVERLNQDELLLSTVLESLIDNAVKYSPEGGRIIVTSQRGVLGKTEITVHNDGKNIPAAKLDQLFKPFSRAEDAAADFNQSGMGLSLYMDKLIMDYLGGKTEAIAEADGHGASFKLELKTA